MQENAPRTVVPPTYHEGHGEKHVAEHLRKLSNTSRSAMEGGTNNHFRVTLDVDATSTELIFSRCHSQSTCILTPQTLSAASALASGSVYVVPEKGKVVIHHDASSATDRKFGAVVFS